MNNSIHQQENRFSAAVRSVSRGCLLGTAFGDAFGIPIECKTFNELQLLRKCWIDQVLHEHPQLAPFKHQLQRQHDNLRQLEEKYHQNQQATMAITMTMTNNTNTESTGMDQKTSSDDAAPSTNATACFSSSSSFVPPATSFYHGNSDTNNNTNNNIPRFQKSLSDDVPTPKNQDLSVPPPHIHANTLDNNNNNNNNNNYSSSAVTTCSFVPARPQNLGPLDFDQTQGHPFITEADNFHAGMWTDDTQLSCAVARAIAQSLVATGEIEDDEFVMQRVASMMAEEEEGNKTSIQSSRRQNQHNNKINNNSRNNNMMIHNNNSSSSSTSSKTVRRAMRRARMVEDDEDAAAEMINPHERLDNSNNNTIRTNNSLGDDEHDGSNSLDDDAAASLSKRNSPLHLVDGSGNGGSTSIINNNNTTNNSNNNNNNLSPLSLSSPKIGGSKLMITGGSISSSTTTGSKHNNKTNNNNINVMTDMRTTIHDDNLVCKNPGGVVADRINFYHIARQHVIEHQRTLVGWGGTRTAVQRLIRPVEETREALSRADLTLSRKKELLSSFDAHRNSGNEQATGNGVLMKLTPLSLVLGLEQALVRRAQGILSKEDKKLQMSNRVVSREKLIVELTRMTHGSGDAIATALVHNEMLCSLFEDFFVSCVFTGSIDDNKKLKKDRLSSTKNHPNDKSKLQHPQQQQQGERVHQDDAVMLSSEVDENQDDGGVAGGDEDDDSSASANRFAGSPLFDRVQSSSKRAALVAAMFQVAIDRGISFCDELSVGDVIPAVESRRSESSINTDESGRSNNNNNNNNNHDDAAVGSSNDQSKGRSNGNINNNKHEDDSSNFQRVSSQGAPAPAPSHHDHDGQESPPPASSSDAAFVAPPPPPPPSHQSSSTTTTTTTSTTIFNNNNNNHHNNINKNNSSSATTAATTNTNTTTTTSILPECRFPESFAKIGALLKKVKDFFSELIRRHQALSEETWLQGDVFPFISKPERERIEKTIVGVSEGGTYYCVSSFIFVWAYAACFAPACAVSCARKDIVPVAIAHSALLGGDTDSNAALIGGIFGVIFGEKSISPFLHDLKGTEVVEEATLCLENAMNALLSGKLA